MPCQVYWYWLEHNNKSFQKLDLLMLSNVTFVTKIGCYKRNTWNTKILFQEKNKGKPKKETKISFWSQNLLKLGVTLLDINNENLHIHISFFVYTKSVKEIFKKTTKGFEMRKQISSKLFYVPLNWEKNWNGTKMFWMKPECNKDFKNLLKSFNRYGNNTACHCFKPNTYFENNKPWSIYKT